LQSGKHKEDVRGDKQSRRSRGRACCSVTRTLLSRLGFDPRVALIE
jgi:hypothetical protein